MAKRRRVTKKPAARSAAKPRSALSSPKGSAPSSPKGAKAATSGAKKAAAPAKKAALAPAPESGRERRRHDPETLRLRAYQPGLTVNDLTASISFYTNVLGFIVGERWTDNNVLLGVSLKAGACSLGLSQDDWAKGKNRKKGEGVRLWCETVQDIDALAERIKSEGGRLTQEPKFQPWGMRLLELDDPDGYHLTMFKNK